MQPISVYASVQFLIVPSSYSSYYRNTKGEKKKKVGDFFSLHDKGCIVGLPTLGSLPILTRALSTHRLSVKSYHSNNSKRSSLAERLSIMVAEENYDDQHIKDQKYMLDMEGQLEQLLDDNNKILTNNGNDGNNGIYCSPPVSERSTSKSTNDTRSQKSQNSQKSVDNSPVDSLRRQSRESQ